ncbi:dihydroxyacetone kinase subunit DhaK [Streptomyces sp. 205]|uniref:Dihydroxyacetone kinase subunit DhaK n=2 Tax=Streptomyces coffeae TaxID=621382 RepID=A0ABS1NHB6_9ACTN|nr:dihydroxyacetone kinase subunit DhaK [Streptomyces coffeae]
MNYTGDVIKFRLAAEIAAEEGHNAAMVLIDDDAALPAQETSPGRRGTAAAVVVERIVGVLAAQGASLPHLENMGQRVVDASNAQDLWINLGLAREGRTFPNDPVMVIE